MIRTPARPIVLAALLLLLGTGNSDGQGRSPALAGPHGGLPAPGEIADVPAGEGTIRGRVVHRTRPDAVAGLPIALFALGADGRPGTRQTRSGPDGKFSFEQISNDPRTVYLLAVQGSEIPFGTRVTFERGQKERSAVIEMADTGTDIAHVTGSGVTLRLDRGCGGIRITETHELSNPGDTVLVVPAPQRGSLPPIFQLQLPAGAIGLAPGRNVVEGGFEHRGDEALFWGPLYPGTHAIDFSYSLASDEQTLRIERTFALPVDEVTLMTWADGPRARGDSLARGDEVEVEGLRYATMKSGPFAAGDTLAFELDVAPVATDSGQLSIAEATLWLELDDAALDVREQLSFDVAGSAPLRSDSDAPLVCMPLPAGAEALRFSADALAMGIQPDATGGLALRGPIRPGRSDFALTYLLRNQGETIHFSRTFPAPVPLLSIYIADTGVRTITDRLHRRRPVRTADRTYIHLEAFQVEAEETVRLDLESLRPRQALPRMAAVGFVASAALLAVAILSAPLRSSRRTLPEARAASATTTERAAIYSAIRDLDDDFETGKISREDHDVMMNELRVRAGELLRQERATRQQAERQPQPTAAETTPREPAQPRFCSQCGAAVVPDARFCSQCGERLQTEMAGAGSPE